MANSRPTIGITMGDPVGIGAEIIVKALTGTDLLQRARFVVFGFSEQIAYTADLLDREFPFHREHHEDIRRYDLPLVVLDYDELNMPVVQERGPGRPAGLASMRFCED